MRAACGEAYTKSILATGEMGYLNNVTNYKLELLLILYYHC